MLLLTKLVKSSSMHLLIVQIWAQNQNSTIFLTPNNLLIVCHSSIMNLSQKTFFSEMVVIFPYISGCYTSTFQNRLLLSLEKWHNSNSFQIYSYSKLIKILSNKRMLHSVTNYSLYISKTMVEKLSHIFIHTCFMKRNFDNLHTGNQWFSHIA